MRTKIVITALPGDMRAVHIEASGRDVFRKLRSSFRSKVPAKHRSYSKSSRKWYVLASGAAALNAWLADLWVDHPRFEVVHEDQTSLVLPESAEPWQRAMFETHRRMVSLLDEMTKDG